jgi:glycosidase
MHPTLYEINTRVWRHGFGKDTTLLEIPDEYWVQLAQLGVDYLWLMGVWQTGHNELNYALIEDLQETYFQVLPDWQEEDVIGSPYAIDRYVLHRDLGKPGDLKILKEKLNGYGLKLLLDFIPNHFHAETSWLPERPDVFLEVEKEQWVENSTTFYRPPNLPDRTFAHGKDPYFTAWQDTIQVNYAAPAACAFMQEQLLNIAEQCDGVRCDMAMLLLPEVFNKTWGHALGERTHDGESFWLEAIKAVKSVHPDFCLLAEVYWDMEWILQQQGFDFTYDKRLRDRLLEGNIRGVREHLHAVPEFMSKATHFLENHDEDRILSEVTVARAQAMALITYTIPGLRFFYEGQWEGRRIRIPVQLGRTPTEYDPAAYGQHTQDLAIAKLPGFQSVNPAQTAFYDGLLQLLQQAALRTGRWEMLNSSDHLLAWQWTLEDQQYQIRINYSPSGTEVHLSDPDTGKWRHFLGPELAYNRIVLGPYQWLILEKGA